MFTFLVILTLACYTATIYYAFSTHTLIKAFAIVSGSTTVIACSTVGFLKIEPKILTQSNTRDSTFYHYLTVDPMELEHGIDYISVIHGNDIKLSEIQTRQWDEGNSLWVLNGFLKNNSQFPINSLKLELMLSDCGPKDKEEKCLSSPESIFLEITGLNIKPHEKSQFSTTYPVEDPNHLYKISTSVASANSITKYMHKNPSFVVNSKKMEPNVDNMVICGGGTSVDHPEYDNRNIGKTMLANKDVNLDKRYRGC